MASRFTAIFCLGVGLAGCQGSGRFTDFGSGPTRPQAAAPVRPAPLTPVPTSPVTSQPLPPPGGGLPPVGSTAAPVGSGLPPIGSSVPIEGPDGGEMRSPTRPTSTIDPPPPPPQPPQVAARPEPAPAQPQAAGPPTRTAVTGNWTAREAAGGTCRITLTSAPTLDLYRANSSGCQSRELQRVNAWELRGDEVYLYEPGGGVTARLKQSGRNFEGAAARTGAPIILSK